MLNKQTWTSFSKKIVKKTLKKKNEPPGKKNVKIVYQLKKENKSLQKPEHQISKQLIQKIQPVGCIYNLCLH